MCLAGSRGDWTPGLQGMMPRVPSAGGVERDTKGFNPLGILACSLPVYNFFLGCYVTIHLDFCFPLSVSVSLSFMVFGPTRVWVSVSPSLWPFPFFLVSFLFFFLILRAHRDRSRVIIAETLALRVTWNEIRTWEVTQATT